jgi:hypothetical protein
MKPIILTFLLGIILTGCSFPRSEASIKKECYDYAYGTPNNGNTQEWIKATKYYYEACLHRNGL